MEFITKINLAGTLAAMKRGNKVHIPAAAYKETSVRSACCTMGKKIGGKFSVRASGGLFTIERTA